MNAMATLDALFTLIGAALSLVPASAELDEGYDASFTRVQTSALALNEWAVTFTNKVEPVKTRNACMGMCKIGETTCTHFSWKDGACFLGSVESEQGGVAGVADLGDIYINSGLLCCSGRIQVVIIAGKNVKCSIQQKTGEKSWAFTAGRVRTTWVSGSTTTETKPPLAMAMCPSGDAPSSAGRMPPVNTTATVLVTGAVAWPRRLTCRWEAGTT